MDLLTGWLDLHLDTLRRYPEVRIDPAVRDAVRSLLAGRLRTARQVASHDLDGDLRAIIVLETSASLLGIEETRCWLDLAVDDEEAERWTVDQLGELSPRFDETFVVPLDVAHHALLPALANLGLGVHKLVLHGTPREALQSLCRTQGAWPDCDALALRVEPLGTAGQVEQIIASRREYFRANPDHGGLHRELRVDDARQETIDRHVRDKLSAAIAVGNQFVILRGDAVMGSFGFEPQPAHPTLGKCAGVGIAFEPAIHGLGLAAVAYRHTLHRMTEVGVDVFKGQTSNPAVIHLARRMGRPLRAWRLRSGTGQYPEGLFDYDLR